MVDGDVEYDADAPGVHRAHQRCEGLIAAEPGIDIEEVDRIVSVHRAGIIHGIEVDGRDAEGCEVIGLALYALQVAVVEVKASGCLERPGNRIERRRRDDAPVELVFALPCSKRAVAPGEAVREDLVAGGAGYPGRRIKGGDDGEAVSHPGAAGLDALPRIIEVAAAVAEEEEVAEDIIGRRDGCLGAVEIRAIEAAPLLHGI